MELQIGNTVFDGWIISKLLGEGGYGKVYEIYKEDFGISVKSALKIIKIPKSQSEVQSAMSDGMDENSVTEMYKQIVDDLTKEIAILSSLKAHPNIVRYEDHKVIKQDSGIGWIIMIRMELLTPLNDYLTRNHMNESEVIRLGKELAGAIEYCESRNLIHRDVKPENTFVDDLGHFKLGDFGIARTAEKTVATMSNKGTGTYMAPEVYIGKPYGKSVDIYSLGLMMYKLLNRGRLPFFPLDKTMITYEDRQIALDRRIRGEIIPKPIDASDELSTVILKACSYNPEDRYQSGSEFISVLSFVENRLSNSGIQYAKNEQLSESGITSSIQNIYATTNENNQQITNSFNGENISSEYTANPMQETEVKNIDKTSSIGVVKKLDQVQEEFINNATDHTAGIGFYNKNVINDVSQYDTNKNAIETTGVNKNQIITDNRNITRTDISIPKYKEQKINTNSFTNNPNNTVPKKKSGSIAPMVIFFILFFGVLFFGLIKIHKDINGNDATDIQNTTETGQAQTSENADLISSIGSEETKNEKNTDEEVIEEVKTQMTGIQIPVDEYLKDDQYSIACSDDAVYLLSGGFLSKYDIENNEMKISKSEDYRSYSFSMIEDGSIFIHSSEKLKKWNNWDIKDEYAVEYEYDKIAMHPSGNFGIKYNFSSARKIVFTDNSYKSSSLPIDIGLSLQWININTNHIIAECYTDEGYSVSIYDLDGNHILTLNTDEKTFMKCSNVFETDYGFVGLLETDGIILWNRKGQIIDIIPYGILFNESYESFFVRACDDAPDGSIYAVIRVSKNDESTEYTRIYRIDGLRIVNDYTADSKINAEELSESFFRFQGYTNDVEMNTYYDFDVETYDDDSIRGTAQVALKEYTTESLSEETIKWSKDNNIDLDGYEQKNISFEFIFPDSVFEEYGFNCYIHTKDYYEFDVDRQEKQDINGDTYFIGNILCNNEETVFYEKLKWTIDNESYEYPADKLDVTILVPKGYDGIELGVGSKTLTGEGDTVHFFRLD